MGVPGTLHGKKTVCDVQKKKKKKNEVNIDEVQTSKCYDDKAVV